MVAGLRVTTWLRATRALLNQYVEDWHFEKQLPIMLYCTGIITPNFTVGLRRRLLTFASEKCAHQVQWWHPAGKDATTPGCYGFELPLRWPLLCLTKWQMILMAGHLVEWPVATSSCYQGSKLSTLSSRLAPIKKPAFYWDLCLLFLLDTRVSIS